MPARFVVDQEMSQVGWLLLAPLSPEAQGQGGSPKL